MKKTCVLVLLFGLSAAFPAFGAPPDRCTEEGASAVETAEACFWYAFHNQRYDKIDPALKLLATAQKEAEAAKDPYSDALMSARIAWLHAWRLNELDHVIAAGALSAKESALLKKNKGALLGPWLADAHENFARAYSHREAIGELNLDPELPLCASGEQAGDCNPSPPMGYYWPEMFNAIVAGFYAGFPPPSANHPPTPAEEKQAEEWEAKHTESSLNDYPWFNIISPLLLSVNQQKILVASDQGEATAGKADLDAFNVAMWQYLDMCSRVDVRYQNFVEVALNEFSDTIRADLRKAMKLNKKKMYDGKPIWDGETPSNHVIWNACSNSTRVPRNYENNFLILGDILYARCVAEGKSAGDPVAKSCDDAELLSDIQRVYRYGRHADNYSRWLYASQIEDRLTCLRGGDCDLSQPIAKRSAPQCMSCHQH